MFLCETYIPISWCYNSYTVLKMQGKADTGNGTAPMGIVNVTYCFIYSLVYYQKELYNKWSENSSNSSRDIQINNKFNI